MEPIVVRMRYFASAREFLDNLGEEEYTINKGDTLEVLIN